MIRLTFPRAAAFGAALLLAACNKEQPAPLYEPVAVARRDIVVSAEAAGVVEPILVVDVKSKASGEIMELSAETGDIVRQGELLVRVDPRDPTNAVAQAEADLDVARAQLANAEATKRRADQMFQSQLISEQEHESANLTYANARAQQVRAERALQTARDQLDDTNVRAPITGTIIQKSVERGQVIASATREVSGGTVLLRMADLNEVQVRTLVDETDIGKIQPGMRATITVDAYPNRPFEGSVLKIEPQSQTTQNVTMFPVLIRIANQQGLLRPGMNAEVEVHIGQRQGVLAIPNAALRTNRDVASAAQVLGLNPQDVETALARQDSIAPANPQLAGGRRPEDGGRTAATQTDRRASIGGSTAGRLGPEPAMAAVPPQNPPQGGGTGGFQLPPGITQEQARAVFTKLRSGQQLTPQEQAIMTRLRSSTGSGSGNSQRRRFGAGNTFQFGGSYIVFVLRNGKPTPVRIQTGLTDMDYSEVSGGLTEQDTVLLLPSASLVQSQTEMRDRFQRMSGGGAVPGMKQQQPVMPGAGARPGGGPR